MKSEPASCLLVASLLAAAMLLRAEPIEEIDLEAFSDDSAEERAKVPSVARTEDGYINVTCDDATLASVLQQFRRTTRMNILSSDSTNLMRRVSASLNHVPWCHALQSILGLANFKMDDRNGIWYVSEKTNDEIQNATRYYSLKHANAQDLADIFNGITLETTYRERHAMESESLAANGTSQTGGPRTRGANRTVDTTSALAGRARATAFPDTNMLILTGTEANLDACEPIINELDQPITQVYIEARFIELSNQSLHKLGIQWNQLESWGASVKGLKAGYESNNGEAANYGRGLTQQTVNDNINNNLNNNVSMDANGQSTSSATLTKSTTTSENGTYAGLFPSSIGEASGAGASAASMAWKNASAFAGQISADDFRLAISAFESISDAKIFSNPRIIVANGKEAKVDMTTKDPYVEVTSDRTGTEGQNLTVSGKLMPIPGDKNNLFAGDVFFSYGITLKVKPQVSPSGLISVEVKPSISYLDTSGDDGINIVGGRKIVGQNSFPIIKMKSIDTSFSMKDGATAIIGGLTQTTEDDTDNGIPYLRKIPYIGPKLFGWKSREKVQTEILVCVTVGIANPETLRKDAGLPTNAILGREYVEGRRFEPGERPNAIKELNNIDTRSLEEIREKPYPTADDDDAFDDDMESSEPAPEAKPEPAPEAKPEPAPEAKPEPARSEDSAPKKRVRRRS